MSITPIATATPRPVRASLRPVASKPAVQTTIAAVLDLAAKTPDELRDLQDQLRADMEVAQAGLRALADHLRDRYGKALDALGAGPGRKWLHAGGNSLLEAEADRITEWDQDALRDLVQQVPELRPYVRVDILPSVVEQMPAGLREQVVPAMTVRARRPRVRLHPKTV